MTYAITASHNNSRGTWIGNCLIPWADFLTAKGESNAMDTERAKLILVGLRDHLKAQDRKDLYFQTRNAGDAVRYLENASSDEEKEEIIRSYYRILFPSGRGGLSDVVLWDEDLETRIALNEPIENAGKELRRIIAREEG